MRDPWYVQYAVMSVEERSLSSQPILYTISQKIQPNKMQEDRCISVDSIKLNLLIVLRA